MFKTLHDEEHYIRSSACHMEGDFTRFQMTKTLGKNIDGLTYFEGRCLTTGFTKVEGDSWLKRQWQRFIIALNRRKILAKQ